MLPDTLSIPLSFRLYAALVLAVAVSMLTLSHVLGERQDRSAGRPYESGNEATGQARGRIPAGFYRVGLLFVIFELESVFVLAWSLVAREMGWAGYLAILIFLAFLLVALLYLSRIGALAWDETASRRGPMPYKPGKPSP